MDGIKGILASKTVWSQLIGFLASMPLSAKYLAGIDVSATAEAISALVTALSFLGGLVFRVTATKQLKAGG